jgi:hypothetical protein
MGAGMIGWVAENGTPIVNGNSTVEPGWPAAELVQSALVLPLVFDDDAPAVLALYRSESEAFRGADLAAPCAVCNSERFGFEAEDQTAATVP